MMAYITTDTALVECDDGKPYSRAADPDMLIRYSGGDNGRGKQTMSLRKPLQKMPAANICTMLESVSTFPFAVRWSAEDLRAGNLGVSTPEQNGQGYHVEGVRSQVRRRSEVGVEGRRAQFLLHEGQVGRLPPHDGDEALAQAEAPCGQSLSVCTARTHASASVPRDVFGGRCLRTVVVVFHAGIDLDLGRGGRHGPRVGAIILQTHEGDGEEGCMKQWQQASRCSVAIRMRWWVGENKISRGSGIRYNK
jgi:hypothetical protein